MYKGYDASSGPPTSHDIFAAIGYLGHILRVRAGGRGGKQFVLMTLANHGGHMCQKELFGCSSTSAAALSEVLSKLEAEHLIERTTSERDRRQLDVSLTEEGTVKADQIARDRKRFEDETLSCLTDDERLAFMVLLDKVARHRNDLEEREVRG